MTGRAMFWLAVVVLAFLIAVMLLPAIVGMA